MKEIDLSDIDNAQLFDSYWPRAELVTLGNVTRLILQSRPEKIKLHAIMCYVCGVPMPEQKVPDFLMSNPSTLEAARAAIEKIDMHLGKSCGTSEEADIFSSSNRIHGYVNPRLQHKAQVFGDSAKHKQWRTMSVTLVSDFPKHVYHGGAVDAVLVVIDVYLNRTLLFPIEGNNSCKECVRIFAGELIPKHGVPSEIFSDGSLTSSSLQSFFSALLIPHYVSMSRAGRIIGEIGAFAHVVQEILVVYIGDCLEWPEMLACAEFAINTYAIGGSCPYELVHSNRAFPFQLEGRRVVR